MISYLSGWNGSLFYILLNIFNALSLTLLADEPALGMLIEDTPVADEEYDKVSNNGGEGEDDDYYGFYRFYYYARVGFGY